MNQGKLEMVKQEMARVNIDILGISELKWTGMGEFNSDDHYIYYCGQESLKKWLAEEVLQIVVKRREVKSKGEKERCTHLNAEFQRIARRNKKAFLSDQCKEIPENNRLGKTRDLFKKI